MFAPYIFLEFKIAFRYLFNRTDENFISLISIFSFLGIAVGVCALIIVMSVMNGFREKLISGILGVSGHIKISPAYGKYVISDYEKLIEKIESFNHAERGDLVKKVYKNKSSRGHEDGPASQSLSLKDGDKNESQKFENAIENQFSNNEDGGESQSPNLESAAEEFKWQGAGAKGHDIEKNYLSKREDEREGHSSKNQEAGENQEFKKIMNSAFKVKDSEIRIERIIPQIVGQGLLTFEKSGFSHNQGVFIVGLKDIWQKERIAKNMKFNSKDFNFSGENKEKVLIGLRLAETLGGGPGEQINLISSASNSLIIGDIPNSKEFEIGSIFESQIFEVDNNAIYMGLDLARYFFELQDDEVNQIELITSNPNSSLELKNALAHFVNSDENFAQDLIFSDWSELNGSYLNALKIEKKVMFLILSLIIFVAVFNIISSLVMLVNEKAKSIAILKSMGLQKQSILRIFLYCGMMISISGIFFGGLLGILFSTNINHIKNFLENTLGWEIFNPIIYLFKDIPAIINPSEIFWTMFLTFIISLLSVLPPSIKASKKDPASILKYF